MVSDEKVFALYGEALCGKLKDAGRATTKIIIKAGEQQKNMEIFSTVLTQMIESNIGRDGWVAALGGGVVGDLAGFAAAVYLRGVAVMQIPTTLLAQVDSAIGGKTGVNHHLGKNLIGAFHQPETVLCDTAVLATLSEREYSAGLAEVVKYGLLGEAVFFKWLEKNAAAVMARDCGALARVIAESVKIKAAIVSSDEREKGRRALLNLGHTFAHAIESAVGYGEWSHGEAVAVGLLAAARLSEKLNGFSAIDTARIESLLSCFALPIRFPDISTESLSAFMLLDKKNTADGMHFVLMRAIGDAELTPLANKESVLHTIEEMKE